MPNSFSRRFFVGAIDTTLLVFAIALALLLRDNLVPNWSRMIDVLPYVAACGLTSSIVLPFMGQDRAIWRFSAMPDYIRVVMSIATIVPIAMLLTFSVNRLDGISRALPILHAIVAITLLVGIRVAFRLWHVRRDRRRARIAPLRVAGGADERADVLLVGLNRLSEVYLQSVAELGPDRVRVVGLLGAKDRHVGRQVAAHPILGRPEDIEQVVRDLEPHGTMIDRVVVTVPMNGLSTEAREALLRIERSGAIRLQFLAELLELEPEPRGRTPFLDGETMQFRFDPHAAEVMAARRYWSLKRALDTSIAAFLLVVLAPVFVLVAILVAATVGFPLAFWQQRPGLGGRPFRLYKFRTMAAAHAPDGRRLTDAERVTRIGTFLRKTRLDELPQLINILVGDMSFVGPRPLLPRDQAPEYRARLLVRPGLTGWAQVVGGRDIAPVDKAALDVWYVRNASFLLDVRIALMTVPMIILGERVHRRWIASAWRDLRAAGIVARGTEYATRDDGVYSIA